jgi:hypothetical protein
MSSMTRSRMTAAAGSICHCQFCQSQRILQRQQQRQRQRQSNSNSNNNIKPPCKNTMKIKETLNRMEISLVS